MFRKLDSDFLFALFRTLRAQLQRPLSPPLPPLFVAETQKGILFGLPALPYTIGSPIAGGLTKKYGCKVCQQRPSPSPPFPQPRAANPIF
jgi:hypothetical protein